MRTDEAATKEGRVRAPRNRADCCDIYCEPNETVVSTFVSLRTSSSSLRPQRSKRIGHGMRRSPMWSKSAEVNTCLRLTIDGPSKIGKP